MAHSSSEASTTAADPALASVPPEAPAQAAATLLIVDDEPESLSALEALLSQYGFRVLTAGSGNEAIEIVNERRPDLVICDLMMPQMTGFDLCLHLHQRAETRGIPIIMLTGFFVGDPLAGVYDRTLLKPVDHEELLAEIRALLARRQRQ